MPNLDWIGSLFLYTISFFIHGEKILFVYNAQKTKSINEALITTTVTKIKNISTDI